MESFAGGVPGGSSDSSTPARLLLEDGREFAGLAFGSSGVAVGEIVFNTAMTGYQEILTDPSYAGQIVAMTCPLIGNYGTSPEDNESTRPQVAGFVVRELSRMSSSWRGRATLGDYLADHGVVAIREVDTRALTRHIRSRGAMRGGIAPLGMATADLRETHPGASTDGGKGSCLRASLRPSVTKSLLHRASPAGMWPHWISASSRALRACWRSAGAA